MTYEHSVHAAGQGSGVITIAQALEIARCADNDLADAHGREAALRDRVGAQSQRLEWAHEQMANAMTELAALRARLAEAEAQRAVLVAALEDLIARADEADRLLPYGHGLRTLPARQALATQPPSDLVALVKAAKECRDEWDASGRWPLMNQLVALQDALDTLLTNQPGWRALIESEDVCG